MDLKREVSILASIAKLDAGLMAHNKELDKIPVAIRGVEKKLAELEANRERAEAKLEAVLKERRNVDKALDDNGAQITRYKNQLMEVKTNKEYTVMLKEIWSLEGEIDKKEERVLELMDEVEGAETENKSALEAIANVRSQLESEKATLEDRMKTVEAEASRLSGEKPNLLTELDTGIRKRYQRVLAKYGDTGVSRCMGEHCEGCGTQLPPQVDVEVRSNNQLITCQSCGRILIYYPDES